MPEGKEEVIVKLKGMHLTIMGLVMTGRTKDLPLSEWADVLDRAIALLQASR